MKKNDYFTSENRTQKISKWMKVLSTVYSNKKPFAFDPTKAALIIVDMQLYFTDKQAPAYIPSSKVITDPIVKIREKFHSMELPVIITRYGLPEETKDLNIMNQWWGGALKETDPLAEIDPSIKDDWSIEVKKSGYDSFYKTSLEAILKEFMVKQLVIVGLVTHLCVESTARSAFHRNYQVYLPIDCIASYTEDMHLNSLIAAAHGFGIPTTSEAILEKFEYE
jgi:isochorismate hydrolase